MKIEYINPFVRFTAEQIFLFGQKDMVAYDYRIYYGLENTGYVVINDVRYDVHPGTLILWRPGDVYSYAAESAEHPLKVVTCNFDYTREKEYFAIPIPPDRKHSFNKNNIMSRLVTFDDAPGMNGTIYLPNASFLNAPMRSLAEEYSKKLKFYELKINTILQDILYQVAVCVEHANFPKNDNPIYAIIEYIQENYASQIDNKEIGAHFGYHPNYINSLIKRYAGVSLHRYVLNVKLSEAMKLLLNTNLNVNEIAKQVNIPDAQYFTRLFKNQYKTTPSEFRKNK